MLAGHDGASLRTEIRASRLLLGLVAVAYPVLWRGLMLTDPSYRDPFALRLGLVALALVGLGVSYAAPRRAAAITFGVCAVVDAHMLWLLGVNGLAYDYYVALLLMIFLSTAVVRERAWLGPLAVGMLVGIAAVGLVAEDPVMAPLRFVAALGAFTIGATALANQRLVAVEELSDRERRLSDALSEQERLLEIVDHSQDLIGLGDPEGRVEFVNQAGIRQLRLPLAELRGRSVLELTGPEARALIETEAMPAVRAGRTWRGTISHTSRSGKLRCYEASAFPISDRATGAVTHVGVVQRDVTQQRETERQKDEFLSTISHELRTPLTSIYGSLGLLETYAGALPPKGARLLEIARTNTERLVRLVNDILDLERIEANRLELAIAEADPADLVRETVVGLEPLAGPAGVQLVSDVGAAARVLVDADRVVQVLTNLVSNAIKFSPRGESVVVAVAPSAGGRMRFTVADKGPGIPPDRVARLFVRFSQLDPADARVRGGTGLGLAISKGIVEQHGGQIGVDTPPGGGAAFWFEVPLAPSAPVEVDPAPDERWRVLVVEDDPSLSRGIDALLARQGFATRIAASLAEARVAVDDFLPDAVLLDLLLPDGNGLELLDRLRERGPLPVIVLSGQSAADLAGPMLFDWLDKPFQPEVLVRALRRALRRPGCPKVLVVDDDPDARAVVVEQLGALGLACLEAGDGAAAVSLARRERPDLIVLDVDLPEMDGFQVVDALRAGRAGASPLIVWTGQDLGPRQRQLLSLGMTRHLTKSRTSLESFGRAVQEMLEGVLPPSDQRAASAAESAPSSSDPS